MHPKQICDDFKSMGSQITLIGSDLCINNPENIYPELIDFAKSYKARIIAYLKNDYSDEEHKIFQTIDKVFAFYDGIEQEMNGKIFEWLQNDEESRKLLMQLFEMLAANGWPKMNEPIIANYEDQNTFAISVTLYKRAMDYFKKGAKR